MSTSVKLAFATLAVSVSAWGYREPYPHREVAYGHREVAYLPICRFYVRLSAISLSLGVAQPAWGDDGLPYGFEIGRPCIARRYGPAPWAEHEEPVNYYQPHADYPVPPNSYVEPIYGPPSRSSFAPNAAVAPPVFRHRNRDPIPIPNDPALAILPPQFAVPQDPLQGLPPLVDPLPGQPPLVQPPLGGLTISPGMERCALLPNGCQTSTTTTTDITTQTTAPAFHRRPESFAPSTTTDDILSTTTTDIATTDSPSPATTDAPSTTTDDLPSTTTTDTPSAATTDAPSAAATNAPPTTTIDSASAAPTNAPSAVPGPAPAVAAFAAALPRPGQLRFCGGLEDHPCPSGTTCKTTFFSALFSSTSRVSGPGVCQ
ncbi:hypothetical protein BDK51DRAFT_39954 [Blyttiomyces helicus]|uniref:CBM1 domain-containing protein n=1 Tax=Blyttiomyces helicus TaxID=388810 RepID=A0A4P9WBI3_9FUNG|nr:hypothetical protein BDK51DRAFT_39954 [Blyttiomyces helicus]|eukprot:RKO88913.1 hypothetical protein BDK51DRAFT_39954 [Blyttiomyces helicus]